MLTRKQHDLLLYIHKRTQEDGIPPSFEEMKDAMDLASKSGIHRLIKALAERGFLRRLPHRARAIEVVRLPDKTARDLAENMRPAANRAIAPARIPMLGRIAAGIAIEAVRDDTTLLDVPATMIGRGNHYALEVTGDSMVNAGILDGDTALIQRTEMADNGDIVVALIDDNEVTLKRFRRKGRTVELEAANPSYPTRVLSGDRVKVQGRLVGLLRRY